MRIVENIGKLSLKNSGNLELFWVGAGSAFAEKNFQNNLLIIKGNTHLMIDFGTTGPQALLEGAGLHVHELEAILPTHSHADHIGGLECVGLKSRYFAIPILKKDKVKMIITEELEWLIWNQSLQGGMRYNERGSDGKGLKFGDFFESVRPTIRTDRPRETWSIDFGGIHLEIFRTRHIPGGARLWLECIPSYGLLIDDKVFFSGDSMFDRENVEYYDQMKKIEVFFHDVQLFDGGVHASLKELQTFPEHIKKKMYLMHYPDDKQKADISDFAGWVKPGKSYVFTP